MVEPAANFLLQTLGVLLLERAKFSSSVKYEVSQVEEDLKTIHSLLKDVDANRNLSNSATFQNFILQLKELAFRAENVLNEVESNREGKGLKKKLQRYMCHCYNVHEVGNEMEDIRSRLAVLTGYTRRLFVAGGGDGSSDSADQEQRSPFVAGGGDRWSRVTTAHEVDRYFVGMGKDIDSLVSMVMDDPPHSPSVISICGMLGLGKTTLARKIYNHQDVQSSFGSRAWVCLTQHFHAESILREIFTQIDGNKPNKGQTLSELVPRLHEVLVQRKCLIVIDDIWEDDHWKMIERAFPKENCKVVLTTRFENIASPERCLYKLGCLSEDEGWELLWKTARPHQTNVTVEIRLESGLEDTGRQIVRKCGGLPLVISNIGGILCDQHMLEDWKMVSNHVYACLNHGIRLHKILGEGYNVLPNYLKLCFLYLSCFPEDEQIDPEQLYLLWMTEGLISSEQRKNSESLRDVAERYLAELANRCMVQVEYNTGYKGFASCRVHVLMREFCFSQAENEKFMKCVDISKHQINIPSPVGAFIHRLAINLVDDGEDTLGTCNLPTVKNVTSLLAFKKSGWEETSFNIGNFENAEDLRILVVNGFILDRNLQRAIGKLSNLTHLSLRRSRLWELPPQVCNLQNLETLDLRVRGVFGFRLPNLIWKMKKLRHLFLPDEIQVIGGGKLKLDGLEQLETLERINHRSVCMEDIIKLGNLRELSVVLKGEGMAKDLGQLSNDMDSLSKSVDHINQCVLQLKTHLLLTRCDFASILTKVITIRSLFCLRIVNCNLVDFSFPYCGQGQGMYEKLVQLEIAESRWYGQSKITFRTNSFPQLRMLHLRHLRNLREWEVERGAMPELRELIMENCGLEKLPDEVFSISTLQLLRFIRMSQQLNTHTQGQKRRFSNSAVLEIQ